MKQNGKCISESKSQIGCSFGWGSLLVVSAITLSFFHTIKPASADLGEPLQQSMAQSTSTWSVLKKNLRVRTFTEVMSPSLGGSKTSVPTPEGGEYLPTNMFNIVWMDYPIAKDLRVVYWQRMLTFFSANSSPVFQSNLQFMPREPRFALRWLDGFHVTGLSTTWDLYLQPGVTHNAVSSRNRYDIGFRTNTSYSFPKSRWSIGLVQEFTTGVFDPRGRGPRAWGWFMPWASYDINSKLSTQHVMYMGITNSRQKKAYHYDLDDAGTPYIQNGLGYNFSPNLQVAAFINNYVGIKPSLQNTWTSLWVSMNLL